MNDETIQLDSPAPGGGPQVRLRVVRGPHEGMAWTFVGESRLTIGRQSPSHIRLTEESALSREHLSLTIRPPHAELVDNASSNGTKVNGIKVVHATLSHGDKFGVGETEIIFELVGELFSATGEAVSARSTSGQVLTPDLERKSIDKPENAARGAQLGRKNQPKLSTVEITEAISPAGYRAPYYEAKTPKSIGSYELLESLGQGGMATVYRGRHRGSKAEVAIKLIRSTVAMTDKVIQLFAREASILSQLNHPRIVRCLEFGFHEQQPFLVMELIKTIDLLRLVDSRPIETRIKTSCWVCSRILQALDYAHTKKFVHRDIKPANILAFREAHRLRVKLADFGLAKCFEHAGFSAMTDEASVRGTIAYMAPEQISSCKTVGPPADIFSMGACLYRLLCGAHPPIAATGVAFSAADLVGFSLPESLVAVIQKAMHPDPNRRYESAVAMEFALRPFHGK